jgi:hypothetical protein
MYDTNPGLPYRTHRFAQLAEQIPELRQLEADVLKVTGFLALEDPRPTTQDDTDLIWAVLFKPRVQELVGWMCCVY